MTEKEPVPQHSRCGPLLYLISSIFILFALVISSVPPQGSATVVDTIQKGQKVGSFHIVSFPEGGGRDASLSIPIPGEGPIIESSLLVCTAGAGSDPGRVTIDVGLDQRLEWAFGGGGYGSFGRQTSFSDGGWAYRSVAGADNVTFLLPEDAAVSAASVIARSPPSPEGEYASDIFDIGSPLTSPEHIDASDLDGHWPIDIIAFSQADSEIRAYLRDGPGIEDVILSSQVSNLLALKGFSASPENPGGVIFSALNGLSGFQTVRISTISSDGRVVTTEIATGLKPGSVGFSLRQDGGAPSITVIDGQRGTVLSVTVGMGVITKHTILGVQNNPTGISEADLDGDGDRDLLLWSDTGNLSLLKNIGSDNTPIYNHLDSGISARLNGPARELDIDGDGDEEIFADTGSSGSAPSVIGGLQDGSLALSYLGLNGTKASYRSLPRNSYGEGGVYDGGEGLLYLMDISGIIHILPRSDTSGEYLHRRSADFDRITLVLGPKEAICVSDEGAVSSFNASWASAGSASLIGPRGYGNSHFNPSSGPVLNLSSMLPAVLSSDITDDYGNTFGRVVLSLASEEGCFITNRDLSIIYSLESDVGVSPYFGPSLEKTRSVFIDSIPFSVGASAQGEVRVGPALVVYDSPPSFAEDMPDRIRLIEGASSTTALDLCAFLFDDGVIPGVEIELLLGPDLPIGYLRLLSGPIVQAYPELYPDLNGEYLLSFIASDGHSSVRSKDLTVEIIPVQDGPRPLHEQVELFMSEGETRSVNVSTMFFDPEGDPLSFALVPLEFDATGIDVDVSLSGDQLVVSSSVAGTGGDFAVRIEANDPVSGLSSVSRITVHLKDVDGMCFIGRNPGPVLLSEDQDQVAIALDGWFVDPDSELSDYTFGTYPSSRLIESSVEFVGSSPYLLIRPTGNLNGDHYVWVDASNGVGSVYDRLDLRIEPVNDPPTLRIEWSEASSGSWSLRGEVEDPDSATGRVQFRIGDGEWLTADGWKGFTLTIPYEDLNVSGSFVFFRADDLTDVSVEEHIRLNIPLPWGLQFIDSDGDGVTDLFDEFPYDPKEVYDTDGDGYGDNSDAFPANPFEHLDTDGDSYGDNSDAFPNDPTRWNSEEVSPDLPGAHRTGRGWLFAIGGAAVVGLVLFFLFTEIGVVAVATAAASIYSKLSTKDVLNHEIRGLIRGYIIANPGDHYSSIKRNLDLNNGTLAYHLRVLEQNGMIKSLYDGVFKRYYPANVNIAKVKKNVSKQEEIFNIILENPGISMEQIGRLIGVSRQVVNYHVKNLIRSGLISYQRDLKSAKFFPNGNGGNGHEGEI